MQNIVLIDNNLERAERIASKMQEVFPETTIVVAAEIEEVSQIRSCKYPDGIWTNLDSQHHTPHQIYAYLRYIPSVPSLFGLTRFPQVAIEAFRAGFSDVLSLPLKNEELLSARERCLHKTTNHNVFTIQSQREITFLPLPSITHLVADNNTTDVHLKNKSVIPVFKTLKYFERGLPLQFVRIHKSIMVNAHWVWRIHFGKKRCYIKNIAKPFPFTPTYLVQIQRIQKLVETDISKS